MKGGRESKKEGFSINEHVETQFAALLSSLNLAFSSPPCTVRSRSQMNFDIPEEISRWGQLNTMVHYSVAWLLFKHLSKSIQAFPVFLLPARHKASTLQATVLLARIPDFPAYSKGWGHSSSPSMVLKKSLSHPGPGLPAEIEGSHVRVLTTYMLKAHFSSFLFCSYQGSPCLGSIQYLYIVRKLILN